MPTDPSTPPAAVERRGKARVSAAVLRLAVAAAVTAVALVGAEYVARYVFRGARSSGKAGDFIAKGAAPSYLANALGFRDREVPSKTTDRYRIVVVGDSFTWGQGIEERERFSNLIEASLGPRYEVLNFGQPGNNMPEHLDVLNQALMASPDFVLLQLYINDFETRQMVRPRTHPLLPGSLDAEMRSSSILYDMSDNLWALLQTTVGIVDTYDGYMARHLRDPNAPDSREAFGMLRQFFERARAAGVPSGAVLFPGIDSMGPKGAGYPFDYIHERVRTICADGQVPCVDLLPTFSTIRDLHTMWVSPFDAHPNAAANSRAANAILAVFGSVWNH